jgi:hypothetical protein
MSKPLYPSILPGEYLTLAKELALRPESASKRSAVERAYFAAFLTCRDLLQKKNYVVEYGHIEDHQYIRRVLKTVLKSKGNEENRLRRVRNEITYNTSDLFQGHDTVRRLDWVFDTSEELIRLVSDLPDNPHKPLDIS